MVKQILFLIFIFLLLNSLFLNITFVKADCVTNGLVLWLRFDEGSGNTTYDWSYHNNNGILYNNPTWVQGIYGYALQFNGINQYVNVGDQPSLRIGGAITVTAWIKTTVSGNYYDVVGRASSYLLRISPNGNVAFVVRDASNSFWIGTPVASQVGNALNVEDGKWHLIAGVYDGQNLIVYADVGYVGSISYNGGIYSGPGYSVELGIFYNYYNGQLDDVRIYNRALSASEIQQIYYNTQPYVCVFTTSTTVYQNQIVQTNTAQGYNYVGIDPFNLGVLALILIIGFLFFVFERRLILIGIGIGFLIAYFFLGINIGFVLLGFIFIILNIVLLRRYET